MTLSIIAFDPVENVVGAAVTSCVIAAARRILHVRPGVGAAVAQAASEITEGEEILDAIAAAGVTPTQAIAPFARDDNQLAAVSFAAHTGPRCTGARGPRGRSGGIRAGEHRRAPGRSCSHAPRLRVCDQGADLMSASTSRWDINSPRQMLLMVERPHDTMTHRRRRRCPPGVLRARQGARPPRCRGGSPRVRAHDCRHHPHSSSRTDDWAARLHGILVDRVHAAHPAILELIDEMEHTGWMAPIVDGGFNGFAHRPDQLRDEVAAAGLRLRSLVTLEGAAIALPDTDAQLDDPTQRAVLLEMLAAVEAVPELLGLGPHLLATSER